MLPQLGAATGEVRPAAASPVGTPAWPLITTRSANTHVINKSVEWFARSAHKPARSGVEHDVSVA